MSKTGSGKAAADSGAGYRWMVASRVVAGFIGGYLLASLATVVLALLLPRVSDTSQAEALLIATLWSFALYAVIVIWTFTTRSATRAWIGVGACGAALSLAWLLLRALSN